MVRDRHDLLPCNEMCLFDIRSFCYALAEGIIISVRSNFPFLF